MASPKGAATLTSSNEKDGKTQRSCGIGSYPLHSRSRKHQTRRTIVVDGFLRKVKDAIAGSDEQDVDSTQQVRSEGEKPYPDVRPASEDPYGDPADAEPRGYGANTGEFGDVRPASEDPYGDPADAEPRGYGANAGEFGDIRPASEDPYGDPADRENA